MRILVAHCHYRQRGGEDTVFDAEASQLDRAGHAVHRFELTNETLAPDSFLGKMTAGLRTVWSVAAAGRFREEIRRVRPDVVHFHNTFPTLSPSAYYACALEGVPAVQTLHNYRLLCASAMFMREGKVCESCSNGRFFNGIRYACYRDSRLASAAVVLMQYTHRGLGTFIHKVDRFIALTDFARQKFIAGGLPSERLIVKPNSLNTDPGVGDGNGNYALFVGRLSPEKGLRTLLRAWRFLPDIPLRVAGDGPLRDGLKAEAAQLGKHISIVGSIEPSEVMRLMGEARFLIVPSEWYEGFPMTVVEAYARGLPVIASNIGSLGEVIEDDVTGRHFPPGDSNALARTVHEVYENPARLAYYRGQARQHFLERYSPQQNLVALLKIYESVIDPRAGTAR